MTEITKITRPEHPADRFKLSIEAVGVPGQCGFCSNPYGPFITTGIYFEFHGDLIICENCIVTFANLFGFAKPSKVQEVENLNEKLVREIDELKTLLDVSGKAIDALSNLRDKYSLTDSNITSSDSVCTIVPKTEETNSDFDGEDSIRADESKSGRQESPFERLISEGSSNLSVSESDRPAESNAETAGEGSPFDLFGT